MDNEKNKTVDKKNDRIARVTNEETQDTTTLTGRPNIEDIVARNEEEERQARIALYKRVGVVMLLVVVIIIAMYFFS